MRLVPLFLALLVSTHTALGLVSPWQTRDTEDPLSRSIAGTVSRDDGTEAMRQAIEADLLALTKEHGTAEDRGLIYASIADMYAQPRGHPSTPEDIDEAAKYAKLALGEPLDPRNACRMYTLWAHGAFGHGRDRPPAEFAAARRRAVVLYLLGLKCALDNGAPSSLQHVPGVAIYQVRGGPDSPEAQAAERQHAKEMEARERGMRLNDLADYRYFFVIDCIFLYDKPPYDPDELKAFSEEILVGHEDVAAGIVRKLKWWQKNKNGWKGPPPRDSDFPPDVRVGTDENTD